MPVFRRRRNEEADNSPKDSFEDRATYNDLLNFSEIIKPLADLIAERHEHLTIGIYGDWGSGKTSFLQQLEAQLKVKDKSIYTIWFNAWKYNKDENLWSALIQTIINQSGQHGSFFGKLRVKYRLWRFRTDLGAGARETARVIANVIVRAFIIFLCVIAGIQSRSISGALNAFFTSHALIPVMALPVILTALAAIIAIIAADPTKLWELFVGGIHFDYKKFERELSYRQHVAFYDQFSEEFKRLVDLLQSTDKPLVIFIDDMDRCLQENQLQILENIKVFLDDTQCIFIIGVDKAIVESAIDARYREQGIEQVLNNGELQQLQQLQQIQQPHLANHRRILHEDYLDKIIPLAFPIPRLRQQQIGEFIRTLNRETIEDDKDRTDTKIIAVDASDPDINIIDPNVKLASLKKDVSDHHVELCSDIFGLGLPPNPRKIKRALRSFRFARNQILARINAGQKKEGERDMLASLLAKLVVIQSQYPQFYEEVTSQSTLLGELESYYRRPDAQQQFSSGEKKSPEEYNAEHFSKLRDILAIKINDADTFVNADVDSYIARIGTRAEIRRFAGRRVIVGDRVPPVTVQLVPAVGPGVVEARLQPVIAPAFATTHWNVPARNPLFTAREDILRLLHNTFTHRFDAKNACIALCGLGGIGKTQIAIEYVYRFSSDYRRILWVNAETRDTLLTDFAAIAKKFRLANAQVSDQIKGVRLVMSWLEGQTDWLLVLDGVANLEDVRDVIFSPGNGHTLLTTRQQITSDAILSIDVDPFKLDEGALLLLRRAGVIDVDSLLTDAPTGDRKVAREIVQTLDGLPLALDQAGAYLEETRYPLATYLQDYSKSSVELLDRRGFNFDHPDPIAKTLLFSFQKVQDESEAAAELLQLCAFLAPDDIPIEMFLTGAANLGETLGPEAATQEQLNELIKELAKFSLLRRNSEAETLSIHPLVQTVIKENMTDETQRLWAARAILLVYDASEKIELSERSQYERYLAQAKACVELVKQCPLAAPQAAHVFDRVGRYLNTQFRYAEAEAFLTSALETLKAARPAHPDIMTYMDNLAVVYLAQRRYNEAAQLLKDVLEIREGTPEPDLSDVATTLNTLGGLYNEQGKYADAEPLLKRALAIRENTLGKDHPTVAVTLNTLGSLYYNQERFDEALEPMQRVLEIRKRVMGEQHPEVAKSMSNLAGLFVKLGNTQEAEANYQQALAIYDATSGPDHPNLLPTLTSYHALLQQLKREEDAAKLDVRIKKIQKSYVEKNE
jgi:tetratricopeptide (TPR) repeat protein/Cdc6-like AAA superfamily ATPase